MILEHLLNINTAYAKMCAYILYLHPADCLWFSWFVRNNHSSLTKRMSDYPRLCSVQKSSSILVVGITFYHVCAYILELLLYCDIRVHEHTCFFTFPSPAGLTISGILQLSIYHAGACQQANIGHMIQTYPESRYRIEPIGSPPLFTLNEDVAIQPVIDQTN